MLGLFLAAAVFLCPQPVWAQLTQNEPAGSTKLAECDFSGTKDCGVFQGYYGGGFLENLLANPRINTCIFSV